MDRPRLIKQVAGALVLVALLYWLWPWRSAVERQGPRPRAGGRVLVLLHGYGAPGDDLVGLAEELAKASPEVTFLVPAGSHRAGVGGRSWLPDVTASSREELAAKLVEELRVAGARVWKVIDGARSSGVACGDIHVGGFSQGGRLAVEVALSAPDDCALGGVIDISGPGERFAPLPPAAGRPRMRVLVAHGRADPVVAFDEGRAVAHHLAAAGHEVRALWFDDRHRIAPPVREAIPRFLAGERVGEPVD
jgi:phospholipase/carboxylesterase